MNKGKALIFIGSNPSMRSSRRVAFWQDTKSKATLNKWINMVHFDAFSNPNNCISFYNVADYPTENNRPLKVSEIKANLSTLQQKLDTFTDHGIEMKVVALGKAAEKALTLLRIPHYAMPHPSGLNRQLNDPKFVEEKINGLKNYLNPSKIE